MKSKFRKILTQSGTLGGVNWDATVSASPGASYVVFMLEKDSERGKLYWYYTPLISNVIDLSRILSGIRLERLGVAMASLSCPLIPADTEAEAMEKASSWGPDAPAYGGTKQVVNDGPALLDYIKSQTKG